MQTEAFPREGRPSDWGKWIPACLLHSKMDLLYKETAAAKSYVGL